MIGTRPWTLRDSSTTFWLLAIATMGESWHNLHHPDPTCARHGVGRGQIDPSARIIWLLENLGWARDVRWPTPNASPASPQPAQIAVTVAVTTAAANGQPTRIEQARKAEPMTVADPSHSHEPHRLMTVSEAAAALRVSRATVYRLVHAGTLPGTPPGRSMRVIPPRRRGFLRDSAPNAPSKPG
jgi:excisionase family DNA binding protein